MWKKSEESRAKSNILGTRSLLAEGRIRTQALQWEPLRTPPTCIQEIRQSYIQKFVSRYIIPLKKTKAQGVGNADFIKDKGGDGGSSCSSGRLGHLGRCPLAHQTHCPAHPLLGPGLTALRVGLAAPGRFLRSSIRGTGKACAEGLPSWLPREMNE